MPIPTIEGFHSFDGQITLNDRTVDPKVAARYYCDKVSLRNLPEAEMVADPAPGRLGTIPRLSQRRARKPVYEGEIQAPSWDEAQTARDVLLGALADIDVERRMTITHRDTGEQFYFDAKPVSCDTEDDVEQKSLGAVHPWTCRFVIAFDCSDPRIYALAGIEEQTGGFASTGGLAPPWTPPITLPALGATEGEVVVVNPGTAPTDPVIDLWGPAPDPIIANASLDAQLAFVGLTVGAGSFIRLDFRRRTALLDGVADVRGYIDRAASTWWRPGVPGLRPGENRLRYRAAGITDPAHALVTADPAYW